MKKPTFVIALAALLAACGSGGADKGRDRPAPLVKPQFEADRSEIGKSGVVRDAQVHDRVCAAAADWLVSRGWRVEGITPSPITGPEGNVEFLLAAVREDSRD